MVCFEIETPSRFEARLRGALASGETRILNEPYVWEAVDRPDERAVALVRCGQSWCQLVPASPSDASHKSVLISVEFQDDAHVEGFIEWFATQLRRRVSPLISVVAGVSGRAPFAYFAVPETVRSQLTRELDILTSPPRTGVRAVGLI